MGKLFKEVMTYETNAQYKFSLAKKMDKYMKRIRELKSQNKNVKATNKKSKKKFYQSRARSLLQEENPESTLSKPKRPKIKTSTKKSIQVLQKSTNRKINKQHRVYSIVYSMNIYLKIYIYKITIKTKKKI